MVCVFDDVLADLTLNYPLPEKRVPETRRLTAHAEWLTALAVGQLIIRGWNETAISDQLQLSVNEVHQLAVQYDCYLTEGHEDAYTLGRLIGLYKLVVDTISDAPFDAHVEWLNQYLTILHGHARISEWTRLGSRWLRHANLTTSPPIRQIRTTEQLAQDTGLHQLTTAQIATILEALTHTTTGQPTP